MCCHTRRRHTSQEHSSTFLVHLPYHTVTSIRIGFQESNTFHYTRSSSYNTHAMPKARRTVVAKPQPNQTNLPTYMSLLHPFIHPTRFIRAPQLFIFALHTQHTAFHWSSVSHRGPHLNSLSNNLVSAQKRNKAFAYLGFFIATNLMPLLSHSLAGRIATLCPGHMALFCQFYLYIGWHTHHSHIL